MNSQNIAQLITLAEHYFRTGNYPFAQTALEKILGSSPNNAKANEFLAYIVGNTGNNELAHDLLYKACRQSDCSSEAFYYLGTSYFKKNQFHEAITCFEKTIKKAGDFFEVLHDLGVAYFHIQKYSESIEFLNKAISIRSNSFEALTNLGNSLKAAKRLEEALSYQSKAININPQRVEGWLNKGVILNELKRYDEALFQYTQAIQLEPAYLEAWTNKGNVLSALKRHDEALTHHNQAINLNSLDAGAWYNKGITLNELKRYDESLAHYDRANQLNPNLDFLLGTLIHAKMLISAWDDFENKVSEFSNKLNSGQKVTIPFPVLSIIDSPHLHLLVAKNWSNDKYPTNLSLPQIPKYQNKKIRIGYFSADFMDHAVSYLTAELFELHDRDLFEVFAFSLQNANNDDPMRTRLVKAFDQFIDVQNLSDLEIAKLARNFQIDIAIDLGGHTKDARTGVFSYRAAPIQVNYLGYPGSLGTEYIDYLIGDKIVIPKRNQQYFSEKIVYLPNTYMVDDSKRKIVTTHLSKSEFNLPETGFIFCCFNNSYKITPDTFNSWMYILKKVQGSILWLSENNVFFQENLRKEASTRGINPNRLIFAKRIADPSIHLARHKLADLFLDTKPYNAHTTAVDALKAGLPVLTLSGESFTSRVAASLLSAIDLSELITHTREEYEALAIELATNHKKITAIKQKLAWNHSTTSLFNTALFTTHIESAYKTMYERYHANLSPDHIYIESVSSTHKQPH